MSILNNPTIEVPVDEILFCNGYSIKMYWDGEIMAEANKNGWHIQVHWKEGKEEYEVRPAQIKSGVVYAYKPLDYYTFSGSTKLLDFLKRRKWVS